MIKTRKIFSVLVATGIALSSAAVAQEATTDESVDVSKDDLSLGQAVEQTPQVGSTYTRESFDAWEMRCIVTENGKDPCNLYQLLKDETGNSVAEINLFDLPPGGQAVVGATVATPLETLLTEQVVMSIDGGTEKRYPFSFCAAPGCYSRMGFLQEEVDALKRGNEAKLRIRSVVAPEAPVILTVSLKGFTAGLNAVTEANKAIQVE
ncbi:MAG: invasion associated locus B family protein [Marinosulfonomonas sp.]